MVRFIFICMAVVAVAIVATGTQFMMDGIGDARQSVVARNAEESEPAVTQAAAMAAEEVSPESLNQIETAAGGTEDKFSSGFSNVAPKGLEEEPASAPVPLTTLGTVSE